MARPTSREVGRATLKPPYLFYWMVQNFDIVVQNGTKLSTKL